MKNEKDPAAERLELDTRRIADAKKRIAKCLNMLETTGNEVRWACEEQKWNDEVAYLIDEAALKLGYALATFERWDDEFDKEVDE